MKAAAGFWFAGPRPRGQDRRALRNATQGKGASNDMEPEQRVEVLYAFRQFGGEIPYGEGPGTLPYTRTGQGGAADASLSEMRNCAGNFWLRDGQTQALYNVDFANRTVLRADLGNAGTWCVALARSSPQQIAALIGEARGGASSMYRVAFYENGSAAPLKVVNLPPLRRSPQAFAIAPNGVMWIAEGPDSEIFDAAGGAISSVLVRAIAFPPFGFLTDGEAPALYSSMGTRIGGMTVRGQGGYMRFLTAGPNGLVLARGNSSLLPGAWQKRVEFKAVYRFRPEERELVLQDLITTPAIVYDDSNAGPVLDGLPVSSYFRAEGADFDEAGNIVCLELTSSGCKFYRCQRLEGENWREKFLHPGDLNREEMEIAHAEYALRAGISAPPEKLERYFEGFRVPPTRKESDQLAKRDLSILDPGKASRK